MIIRPAGEQAVLVELADLAAVHRFAAAVRTAVLPGVVDVVPGYRTVLIRCSGQPPEPGVLRALPLPPPGATAGRLVKLHVRYDGPDLAEVARLTGLRPAELVARHVAPTYLVAFLGFTPGFPYLVGLDPALHVPRRATPRTAVAAGSVGLAGDQTGVYPRSAPGGWQLIGRTDAVLFDPVREPPALLSAGDRVRFVSRAS